MSENWLNEIQVPLLRVYTFEEKPNHTYDICSVCFWEDDGFQLDEPDREGGANHVSLNQARENYKAFVASEERLIQYVRKPKRNERRGIDWDSSQK